MDYLMQKGVCFSEIFLAGGEEKKKGNYTLVKQNV